VERRPNKTELKKQIVIDKFTLSYLRYIYRYCYHIKDFTKRKKLKQIRREEESTQRRAQRSRPHIFSRIDINTPHKPIKNPSIGQ
jgi:hypothetical protein